MQVFKINLLGAGVEFAENWVIVYRKLRGDGVGEGRRYWAAVIRIAPTQTSLFAADKITKNIWGNKLTILVLFALIKFIIECIGSFYFLISIFVFVYRNQDPDFSPKGIFRRAQHFNLAMQWVMCCSHLKMLLGAKFGSWYTKTKIEVKKKD